VERQGRILNKFESRAKQGLARATEGNSWAEMHAITHMQARIAQTSRVGFRQLFSVVLQRFHLSIDLSCYCVPVLVG
jgi:hypothetical protein